MKGPGQSKSSSGQFMRGPDGLTDVQGSLRVVHDRLREIHDGLTVV